MGIEAGLKTDVAVPALSNIRDKTPVIPAQAGIQSALGPGLRRDDDCWCEGHNEI